MSKLKCWKKVNDIHWKFKDTSLILDKLDNYWDVILMKPGEEDYDVLDTSHSKKEATEFAQKYMKKHDICRQDVIDPYIERNKDTLELIRKRRKAEKSFSKEFITDHDRC